MLTALHAMPTASLRSLSASLQNGVLSAGITRLGVQQAAGSDAAVVQADLLQMHQAGMSPTQMALLIEAICDARDSRPDPAVLFDLVLSGPDLPSVPTADTAAVVHTLISQARQEILLVGYAIHNGRRLFEPLARRMRDIPGLRVTFCIDIARARGDTATEGQLIEQFARDFRAKHWPWELLPDVFFDRRAFRTTASERASLHAKCIVVDRERSLVTSANFTEAAQHRNIEAGILVNHAAMSARLADYFAGLVGSGQLEKCPLPS